MDILLFIAYVALALTTFALMEVVAWATHKYIMHGVLWVLHRDHHQGKEGFFEQNDWFSVFFSTLCIGLFWYGSAVAKGWVIAVAIGIFLYGIAYFLVHDVIIHQRVKWFSHSRNRYVKALRWAHRMHHKHLGKDHGESFGFLWVARKYWDKIIQDDAKRQRASG